MPKTHNSISVIIIDDHAVLRAGLSSLLGTKPEIKVVGEAGDGETGIALARQLEPDVAIVDLMMPDMDGVETTRRIRQESPRTNVLIFTTYGSSNDLSLALKAGACGALVKNAELPELLSALRAVANGQKVISPDIKQLLAKARPIPQLSPRQSEILDFITRGLSNQGIAQEIGISIPMVKEHLNALFEKLGAANRTEAVAIALRKHLLKI